MAMVAAGKLDHLVAPGGTACQTQRAHRGFGTGVDQTHLIQARDQFAQAISHGHFARRRRAIAEPARCGLLYRFDHMRMGVTGDHRSPGADIIDIAVTIHINQAGTLRAFDEHRRAADGGKCTYR